MWRWTEQHAMAITQRDDLQLDHKAIFHEYVQYKVLSNKIK